MSKTRKISLKNSDETPKAKNLKEENEILKEQVKLLVDCLIDSSLNCIVIYPNNDIGSDFILEEYKRFENNPKFRIFPSLRFEYFLVILKNAQFTIGNSSAGVREAPYYNIPTINIGNRQNNRVKSKNIISIDFQKEIIISAINLVLSFEKIPRDINFGDGNSDKKFFELLQKNSFWKISNQKQFKDL